MTAPPVGLLGVVIKVKVGLCFWISATASAVLSDISALRYNYCYEYKKLYQQAPHELTSDYFLKVYVSFDDIKNVPKDKFEWIEEWRLWKHVTAEAVWAA